MLFGLKSTEKMSENSLSLFPVQQHTSALRRQNHRCIYSEFTVKLSEAAASIQKS